MVVLTAVAAGASGSGSRPLKRQRASAQSDSSDDDPLVEVSYYSFKKKELEKRVVDPA